MARRASSSFHPGALIGVAAALAIAVMAGKSLLGKKSSAFAEASPLSIEHLLENGNSLRDSEYVVEGEVDEKFFRPANPGQVVSLRVSTAVGDEFVPIEIRPELSPINIERQQRYSFKVRIRDGGIPVATGISRL